MIDRAHTLEPDQKVPLSEKVFKEGVPIIVEVATMLLVADKLGPLNDPNFINTLFNYTVLYGSGIISRFGADVMFARANEQDINTKNSFVKGLLTAMGTAYFLSNPHSNAITEATKNLEKIGTVISHSLQQPDVVAQAPSATPNIPTFTPIPPTMTPTEIAPTVVAPEAVAYAPIDTQGIGNIVLSIGIGLGALVPLGIGVKLYGETIAKKFAETKKNIGDTVQFSREFFSKLRNVGKQSPESVLDSINQVSQLIDEELTQEVYRLNPNDHRTAQQAADRLNELKMTIHDLEEEVRSEFGLSRVPSKRSRIG